MLRLNRTTNICVADQRPVSRRIDVLIIMQILSLSSLKRIRDYLKYDPVFNIAAILAIVGAFSFGCLAFLSFVINIDVPFHVPPLDSPIVGWSTLHQYPKQQESFYYVAGVVTIVSSTLGALIVWLWSA